MTTPAAVLPRRSTATPPVVRGIDGRDCTDIIAMPAGPALVAALAGLEPRDIPDVQFPGVLAAWKRAGSWLESVGARFVAELSDRDPSSGNHDFAREELMCAMHIDAGTAFRRLTTSRDLRRLPATRSALERGLITFDHAAAMSHALVGSSRAVAARAEAEVLSSHPDATPRQLKRYAQQAVAAADANTAERLAELHHENRRMWMQPADTGEYFIGVVLPTDSAASVMRTIDRFAERSDPADDRPLEVRRADALVDLMRSVTTGSWPAAAGFPDSGLAAATPNRRGRTAGASFRDGLPGGGIPATSLHVVVPLSTLQGHSDLPGDIPGFGPITADTARRMACDSFVTRMVTDPLSGQLLDLGRTRRTPTARLRRHVLARDEHCQFAGCEVPWYLCEIHHAVPWASGGTTDPANLVTLCARHHAAVHKGRWRLERNPDETTTWFSPAGQVVHVSPPGRDPAPDDG